ncbi:MAG TPA: DNA polymerase III subunit delta [Flavobacteriaceae bacterium]|nr:DNA polymerase III subunit delta [Flavobacteriaceae bacterium]
MNELNKIFQDIKNKQIKPLYFLMGEEPYFIDLISDYIEKNVLREDEKSFNQQILYGLDVKIDEIVASAKRYPMMAERQVIIVKEAQHLSRQIDSLQNYAENPVSSTVLVFCYKNKTLDKRKKLYKSVKKSGIVFEGKPLYDDKIPGWIKSRSDAMGFSISHKGLLMLAEFLGNDLAKIDNELNKLKLIIPSGIEVTPELIEENIGISKDFNNFELQNAIGERNVQKAHRILNYFAQNPKDNPMMVTTSVLFNFLSKLMIYHSLPDKSKANVASKLGVHPFFANDFITAGRNYPLKKVSGAITLLREADVKSKGVGSNSVPQGDLLKELVVKMMN